MLADKLRSLPDLPGVYHYFDANGRLLYIGKAKSLKKRVRSYFRFDEDRLIPAPGLSSRIQKMVMEVADLTTIIVGSEHDALILENSLIKQLKPKYNILLRDDKTYPYIYCDMSEPYPRFEITRRVVKGGNIRYYGPFTSGAKEILQTIYERFPLVQKKSCLKGKKRCLFFQIGRCLGPCEEGVSTQEYSKLVQQAEELINSPARLREAVTEMMMRLASEERYEEAAIMRDRLKTLENISIQSTLDLANTDNFDLIAVEADEVRVCIVRLFYRHGKLVSSAHHFAQARHGVELDEVYRHALLGYYTQDTPLTHGKIYLAHKIADMDEIAQIISQHCGRSVKLLMPKVGEKRKLADLAITNALELLRVQAALKASEEKNATKLAELLGVDGAIERIEVFDNSHISGNVPVGSMIVWEGEFRKEEYRHYNLTHSDEVSQMREMLTRRIERFATNPPPDLWLLDGGAVALQIAKELLDSAGVYIAIAAIAKEKDQGRAKRAKGKAQDLLYTLSGSIKLPPSDPRLQLLQRLRDEAHRFALSYHRHQRTKQALQSSILQAHGIGPAIQKKLLSYFGGFEAIRHASIEELRQIFGEKRGTAIFEALQTLDEK
ncbi:MAG: excinuclease ABC subunit UvrC [Campylobacterales bacterium]